MKKLILTLVFLGLTGSTQAGTIVLTDSGNIGEFTFTNTGINGTTATIDVSVPSITSEINTVNGVVVPPEIVSVNTPTTLLVTPVGNGVYDLVGDYTKTVGGIIGQQAIMDFNLTIGNTPILLPNFFNASGSITSLVENNNPNYDFSLFAGGLGKINLTFTATSFTNAVSFADVFSTVGATAVGNGSFSQSTVPGPSSIILLGVGIVFLGCAARRK